jgi:Glycosyl hydrolases family 16
MNLALRSKPLLIIYALFSICLFTGCRKSEDNTGNKEPKWKLIFQDDFTDSILNRSAWSTYTSPGQEGNGLRRPEAISLKDGNLVVTAAMIDSNLVSGGMAQNINQTFGKYEFRVRVEKDSSDAMSGVVLTWPQSERWPMDGENDIYETGTDGDRHSFSTNIHYGTSANTQFSFVHEADASTWHIMSMVWTSDYIKIYRDSSLVWTLADKNAIPRVNHHLCIQLDAFKPFVSKPVHMFVDWVKIYCLEK